MKTFLKKTITLLAVKLILTTNVLLLQAAQPDWWSDYSIVDEAPRQDNAVATIGQAKHMVQKAYQYLEAELASSGGAGAEVTALYNRYCVTAPANPDDDVQPLTIGMLKYFAKPFYDRLNSGEVALDTRALNPASMDIYPWTSAQTDDDDLALATLSQLKFAFSFDLSQWTRQYIDTDNDFVDSMHEVYFGFSDNDDNDVITNTSNNTLNGSSNDDQLYGGIGNDIKLGGAGDDVYYWYLGDGNDFASDSSGENFLQFGEEITPEMISYERGDASSHDYLYNWIQNPSGNDLKIRIQHPTNPNLSGSFIIDRWSFYLNNWSIRFHNGTILDGDRLATPINDTIRGTVRSEILDGLSGDDDLRGGDGDDQLTGGIGNDLVYGQNGNDVYIWNFGDGHDYFLDIAGANELHFGTGIGFSDLSFERGKVTSSNYLSDWSELSNGQDLRIIITHPTDPELSGSIVIESWTSYRDHWNLYFEGQLHSNGSLLATHINDNLTTGSGDDILQGLGGDDVLNGGYGNDQLTGGAGNDIVNGGFGFDSFFWEFGDGDDFYYGSYRIGSYKTLRFGPGITSAMVTIENDSVGSSNYLATWLDDPSGSDRKFIVTHPSDSTLSGSVVIDSWTSFGGYWRIEFEDGEVWDAAAYPDPVNVIGTTSSDTINGDSGADNLQGDSGNDLIYAGWGEDKLSGDQGFDFIDTGYGSDVVSWNLGDQHDFVRGAYLINEQKILKLGFGITPDMLSFEKGNITSTDFIASQLNAWTADTFGSDLRVIITHPSNASLSGSIIIDNWNGYRDYWFIELSEDGTLYQGNYLTTAGSDTIAGTNADDLYRGGTGNDTLNGNFGDDSLYGDQGDDTLNGGNGDDSLYGGADNDLIYGNNGNDAYYWNFGDGHDYFSDVHGLNTLVLGAGITEELWQVEKGGNVNSLNYLSSWSVNLDGPDLRISITHPTDSALSGSIVINSWATQADHWQVQFPQGYPVLGTLLGTNGNDTLTGSVGSDLIYGGLSKDYCRGAEGDDTYIYHLGDGFDVWKDDKGLNSIRFGEDITPEMLTFRLYDIMTTSVSEIPFLPPERLEDLGIVIESNEVQVGFIAISNWIYNTMNWRVEFTALDPNTGLVYPAIERTRIRDELLPWDADLDNDTIPDWWELLYGLDTAIDNQIADTDNDGLLDTDEFSAGTDPTDPDSDGDRLTDGQEVLIAGTNPLVADLDELDTDFNSDGLDDSVGVVLGIEISESDNDGDSIGNADELVLGTNPILADTDGDGIDDGIDEFPLDPYLSARTIGGGDSVPPVILLLTPSQATIL